MDFVTPVVDLVVRIWGCVSPQAAKVWNLQKNLISLSTSVGKLKARRNDVMKRVNVAESNISEPMERTDVVKDWLERVQTIVQEVDDILQQPANIELINSNDSIIKRCCCSCRSRNTLKDYKLGDLVIEKLSSLNELMIEGEFDVVANIREPDPVQEIPTPMVVGMEPNLEKCWSFVNDDRVRTLGMYGMGGVGKTTLMKKLNNEFLKKNHDFNMVVYVVVSQYPNLQTIQDEIVKSLGLSMPSGEMDPDIKARHIFKVLSKKKFVLLLDDIWTRIDLEKLGVPSFDNDSTCNTKSMVIFTTRSEVVCGQMEADETMKVVCLEWNEAWSLFQKKVGKQALECDEKVLDLAKNVAKECLGLPLALITVGRAMASKRTLQEWNHAVTVLRKSAAEFPGMEDKVLKILKFSYDNLRNEKIKSCFLYCSLFPEDHLIDKETLVDYWISEGLLDDFDNIDEGRAQGHDIIEYLKGVSLLQSDILSRGAVQMHDVIRDLALWIVSDYGKSKGKHLADNGFEPRPDQWEKAERISVATEFSYHMSISSNCSKLSTLIFLCTQKSAKKNNEFFQHMPNLRVLSIKEGIIDKLSPNICRLSILRYLNLRGTGITELPNELKSLVELMYLFLSETNYLGKIPCGVISCLTQLRVLDVYRSGFYNWETEDGPSLTELESLKHLNDLGITISTLSALKKLVSIRKFELCTRRLCIRRCDGLTSLSLSQSSSSSLSLANFKNLKQLYIAYCDDLKELIISGRGMQSLEYLGLDYSDNIQIVMNNVLPSSPQQQSEFSLANLQHVEIAKCGSLKNLTWLVYARNLRRLELRKMENLEEIIGDDYPKFLEPFPKLQHIYLTKLYGLTRICSNPLDFPALEIIQVLDCDLIKKLPFDNNSGVIKNNTLRGIYGGYQWWESLEWENDTIKSYCRPYFVGTTLRY